MAIYLKKFENHTQYETYINGSGAILPNVSICTTEGDVHYNPYVDPCASEKVKTTYEFVDLELPSGVKWANKNIGALTVTDYGQKFQWGDIQGFTHDQVSGSCKSKYFAWSDYKYISGANTSNSAMTKYNSTDGLTALTSADDAAVANMGGSWVMPTQTHFNELLNTNNCTKAWTNDYQGSGVKGYLFTSVRNNNTLFLPAAGNCYNGTVNNIGYYGYYWSASLDTSNVAQGGYLYLSSLECGRGNIYRRVGYSVRAVIC